MSLLTHVLLEAAQKTGLTNSKAELSLGYRGTIGLALHPVIRLRPTITQKKLEGVLQPGIELRGACDNLEGEVPCSLTWIVARYGSEPFEIPDPREDLKLKGGDGAYQVMVGGSPLSNVNVVDLDLLGEGELGYRIKPVTPRDELTVPPKDSKITFAYPFEFAKRADVKVGQRIKIQPKYPAALDGQIVRLTLVDSDDPKAQSLQIFEWTLGPPAAGSQELHVRFGCSTPSQGSDQDHDAITLDYCDHFEQDAELEYGARIEILRYPKKGAKPKVAASIVYQDLWTGKVPSLGGLTLHKNDAPDANGEARSGHFEVNGWFKGFDPVVALNLEIDLWAQKGSEVRRAEDVLREVRNWDQLSPTGIPRLLERQFEVAGATHAATAHDEGNGHEFRVNVLDIDALFETVTDKAKARELLEGWSVFAEVRLSKAMTGGVERPMMQVARSGAVGVDHGVVGRAYSAAGSGTNPISFSGALLEHARVAEADLFDMYVLAMCIYTEAANHPDPAKRRLEMLHVGGVVMNRVKAKYRAKDGKGVQRHDGTYYDVVLDDKQFSKFNSDCPEKTKLKESKANGKPLPIIEWASTLPVAERKAFEAAVGAAEALILDNGKNPFASLPNLLHYYSPVSMKGGKPAWEDASKRHLVPEIDDNRFRWYAGVP